MIYENTIDCRKLQELSDTVGPEGVVSLIDLFFAEFPEQFRSCMEAAGEHAFSKVRATSHPMKTGAGYLGANHLSQLFAELESAAKMSDADLVDVTAMRLPATFQQTGDALRTIRERLRKGLPVSMSPAFAANPLHSAL